MSGRYNGLGGGVVFPINMKFPIRIIRGSPPCFQFDVWAGIFYWSLEREEI
jgi:hypothetical protein